jgi:hypothetical protein
LDEKRRWLQRRSDQVDRAEAALEQLKDELQRMHRESLEARLATTELWTRLCETVPPETLTETLGRIRSALAEHYRLADQDLNEKRTRLKSIGEQLCQQHAALLRRKRELDRWSSARQDELQQQASRLSARQRELARREAELNRALQQQGAGRPECPQRPQRPRAKASQAASSVSPF